MPKQLTTDEIELLKERELEILAEIDRVCNEHNINYSLGYGSLLGAIRHRGFIPWDDDVDIIMERNEYESFKKIANDQLKEGCYFVDAENSEYYGLTYGKIMLSGTVMKESSLKTSKAPDGVFVDVFPLDVVPNSKKLREKQFKRAKSLKRTLICREKYYFGQKGFRLLIYRLRRLGYLLIPKKQLLKKYRRNARTYENCEECNCIGNLGGVYSIEQDTYPREVFSKYRRVQFENIKCMCVNDYDIVLKRTYGDYNQLPPEEKRIPHHYVEELKL